MIRGGYRCNHAHCNKTFDRACDLNHHARKHINKEDRHFVCVHCNSRFLYPKDLLRHQRKSCNLGLASGHDLHSGDRRPVFAPVQRAFGDGLLLLVLLSSVGIWDAFWNRLFVFVALGFMSIIRSVLQSSLKV